jgi:hypothetical protein
MAFVIRRKFRFTFAGAAVITAIAGLSGAAAADERRAVPPSVGRNEVVVAATEGLRDQIRACWNVPAMTQREDFRVHVVVELRPDRTVRTARVVGTQFSFNDPHRRAVAQSARHAVLSSRCNPLLVPDAVADKGERITLTFNPAEIFGR